MCKNNKNIPIEDARILVAEATAEQRQEFEKVNLPGVIYYRHAVEKSDAA